MKKTLSFLISLFMVSMVLAVNPPVPMPVRGSVTLDGFTAEGISVTVRNTNSGQSIDHTDVPSLKTSSGMYLFDMSELNYAYGDTIEIKVCELASCKASFVADYDHPKTFNFVVSGGDTVYVCWDGSQVSNPVDCPAQPVPSVQPVPSPTASQESQTLVDSNDDLSTSIIDVFYYQEIDVVIANKKLSKLLDGPVEFDSEDYDVKETISLNGIVQTSMTDVDFGTSPCLVIPEGGIKYEYNFIELIDLTEITEDETLKITILGEDYEIIKATNDRVTLISGEEFDNLEEGGTKQVNDITLTLTSVGEGYVRISYNGETATVNEKETIDIGGLEVYLDGAYPDDTQVDTADIRVGEDIEETVDDGDDYKDGSLYQWDINFPYSIGISNQEDYDDLDDDSKCLTLDSVIELPNDFAIIKVEDITSPVLTDLTIEVDGAYLRVYGGEDSLGDSYDEVFVDSSGIYDDDLVLLGNKVRIGDSNLFLELSGTCNAADLDYASESDRIQTENLCNGFSTQSDCKSPGNEGFCVFEGIVKIGDLTIELDLSDILYKGVSFAGKDETFLDESGIIFSDPEEAVLDKKGFKVRVPEERPEVTVTIGDELVEERPEDCPACPDGQGVCPDGTATTDVVTCPVEIVCTETVCPTEKVCDICEECPETDSNLAATIIAGILGLGGGAGLFFGLFNKKIFTGMNTGVKMYRGRDGSLKLLHKHPGTRGYHNPETSHRAPEKHPRGMVDVANKYQKNPQGDWEYLG